MDGNIYQRFQADERTFIGPVGDWTGQVRKQYASYLTEFLDPRQSYVSKTLIRQSSDLRFMLHGGYEQAERKKCPIFPDYYEPVEEDFETALHEIHYPSRFANLSHGKVLGTLVGAGIKRSYFGDIISDGDRWQVFIADEVDHFVAAQITKIGKVAVRLGPIKCTEMILPKDSWTQERGTVSSMRLDSVISEIYNISRQRSRQLIEAGKVKVSRTENTRPDSVLELLDVISVGGYDRVQIQKLEGETKKEEYRVLLGVLHK